MAKKFENIRLKITTLTAANNKLYTQSKMLNTKINKNLEKIEKLRKSFPQCYSCGHHTDPKSMVLATQEDVDNWYDSNEGYAGPEVNEYYCGC